MLDQGWLNVMVYNKKEVSETFNRYNLVRISTPLHADTEIDAAEISEHSCSWFIEITPLIFNEVYLNITI